MVMKVWFFSLKTACNSQNDHYLALLAFRLKKC
jgi:hypothetical protein